MGVRSSHSEPLLGDRYRFPGRCLFRLGRVQEDARLRIMRKLLDGVYATVRHPCDLCLGSDFELLSQVDRWGLPVSIVVCRGCGLVQSSPYMTSDSCRRFYRDDYRILYNGAPAVTEDYFLSQATVGRHIMNFFAYVGLRNTIPAGCLVLDVGAGAGGMLVPFADAGYRTVGIDLGGEFLRYGQSHGLDLREGTLTDTALEEHPGLIIFSHVLEHMVDVVAELRYAHAILRDDGLIFVALPGLKCLHASPTYLSDFRMYAEIAHASFFSLRTLDNLMGKCGFSRLRGSEQIWAIYKKASGGARMANDYWEARRYLLQSKKMRYVYGSLCVLRGGVNWMADRAARGLRGTVVESSARCIYGAVRFRNVGRGTQPD